MAQQTSIQYISDLSGKTIVDSDKPTLAFGWDGTDYTIDLTAEEAEKFYSVMEKYLSVASKVSGRKGTRKTAGTGDDGPKPSEVRAWAKENGHDLPERGRIPADVRQAYDAAH